MKNFSESLLDDFDKIEKNQDIETYLKQLYDLWAHDSKKGCDIFGKKIKIGDIVILNQSLGTPCTGLVIDINSRNNYAAVSIRGDGNDIRALHGPHKGEIPSYEYFPTEYMIKIDKNILKAIYNMK